MLWTVALTDDARLLHVSNLRPMTMPPDQRCFLWLKTGDRPRSCWVRCRTMVVFAP